MCIPNTCVTCPYESECDSALNLADCYFYNVKKENKLMTQLKKLIGKLFK